MQAAAYDTRTGQTATEGVDPQKVAAHPESVRVDGLIDDIVSGAGGIIDDTVGAILAPFQAAIDDFADWLLKQFGIPEEQGFFILGLASGAIAVAVVSVL